MIQPLEQKKRQKIFLGVLVVVLIITGFVWYLNYSKGPSGEGVPVGQIAGTSALDEKLKTIKLDLGILDTNLFKSLKSHGALPVTAGETGRTNPFEKP